jgi:AcrR family transcriptional regulator
LRGNPIISPGKTTFTSGMVMKQKRISKVMEPKLGRRSSEASGPGPEDLARIALELFAERHFASVSIRDIGRAANVNSSMIYYHYKDKEDLFRAAIETAIDEAFSLFANHCNSAAHENAADAIDKWFDVHVELCKQLRNVVKISLDCKGVIGVPDANEPIKRFYRHENKILQGVIREGMDQGIFKKVDPPVVATMISTMLDGIMARSFFLKDFDMLATVREFKKALWQHLGYQAREKKPLQDAKAAGNGRKSGHFDKVSRRTLGVG